MGDVLTDALRALHAAGKIRAWVRPGMRVVDDEAPRSYMVVMPDREGGFWLSQDDMLDDPGDPEWCNDDEMRAFRVADDAVTTAALLPIVREARGDSSLSARCRATLHVRGEAASGLTGGPWDIVTTSEHVTISLHGTLAPTEREALTVALVAAVPA